jgi:hypothetical protein
VDAIAPDGVPLTADEADEAAVLLEAQGQWLPVMPPVEKEYEEPEEAGPEYSEEEEEADHARFEHEVSKPHDPDDDAPAATTTGRSGHRNRRRARSRHRRRSRQRNSSLVLIGIVMLTATSAMVVGMALIGIGRDQADTARAQSDSTGTSTENQPQLPSPVPGEQIVEASLPSPVSTSPIKPERGGKWTIPPADPREVVDVFQLPRLNVRWQWKSATKDRVLPYRLSFTGDGKWLVAAARDLRAVGLFEASTGAPSSKSFDGHARYSDPRIRDTFFVRGLAPLPGGRILSIATDQRFALRWDAESLVANGGVPCPAITRDNPQSILEASRDGRFFLTGGTSVDTHNGASKRPPPVVVTELETGRTILSFEMNWGLARFTEDSSRLVVAHDRTGLIRVYRLDTGEVESEVTAPVERNDTQALAISPDGRYVMYQGIARYWNNQQIYLCEVASGKHVKTLTASPAESLRTHFSRDGKWMTIAKRGVAFPQINLLMVDTRNWIPTALAPLGAAGWTGTEARMQFSPDGSMIATIAGDAIIVFDVPSPPAVPGPIASVASASPFSIPVADELPAGSWRIASQYSAHVLGLSEGATADGTRVVTARYREDDLSQQWRAVPAGDGWYYLQNLLSGTVMTVSGNRAENFMEIMISAKNDPPSSFQHWKPSKVPEQELAIHFLNRGSGKTIAVEKESRVVGARIVTSGDLAVGDKCELFGILPIKPGG